MLRVLIFLALFYFSSPLDAKVYDCFPFFNEIELLKIRLNELNDVVDYFVIVESVETQRGNEKPMYFQKHKKEFSYFLPKIISVVVDERHPNFGLWQREHYQRNCILRGLKGCNSDDLILISDVDEIPRKNFIHQAKKQIKKFGLEALGFQMSLYRFQLNRSDDANNKWWGTVVTTYDNVVKHSPQFWRDHREKLTGFKNAGWHFTWIGDRDRIRQKMQSVVEGTDDISNLTDEVVDRWIQSVPAVPIDASFPKYIQEHEKELYEKGLIALY